MSRNLSQPPSINWEDRIDGACSEAEVLAAAREFIASFDPYEIESLPKECRPQKMFDAADVAFYASELVQHRCDEKKQVADLVHKLADFFAYATVHLSQIAERRAPGQSGGRAS
jgi:hypothetical protein